jgi:prolyl-tRNA synthetase
MGSYGIGPSRIMGVLVEKFHDDKGIVWPEAVAPFKVHLLGFNLDDAAVMARAEEIYNFLTAKGIEVLFDDRNKGPGEKFADSDLIGIPHRLVVSKKTGEQVEYKPRNSENAMMVTLDEALTMLQTS